MRRRLATPPRGVVLLLGLGLLLASAAGLAFLGGSATLLSDKQRGNQLSDAASLSVAQWYAQSLNYQAYANRAIVANEVMIAQSLTALAWAKQANTLTRQAAAVGSFIPGLQTFSQWAAQAVQAAQLSTQAAVTVELPLRSAYTRALQASQEAMHLAVNPFATQSLINEVIWSGDKRFFGQYLPTSDVPRFYRATRSYSGDERRLMAQHVTQELDRFTQGRGFDHRLYLLPTFTCIPTNLDRSFSKLIRRGATRLSDDYTQWETADTVSVHQWFRRSRWNPTCRGHAETIPLGWGAAITRSFEYEGFTDANGALAASAPNPRASQQAQGGTTRPLGYLGLSGYRDLSEQDPQSRQSARYRIPVLVRLPTRNTQAAAAVSEASLLGAPATLGTALWSLSVAVTEFVDTSRLGQSPTHLPSLFFPYWRAQLAEASSADQAAAVAIAHNRKEP